MGLKDQISGDLKDAMKARDKERTSVLRMLLSELKYAQAAVDAHKELPDAEVLKVLSTYHKRLTKSLDDFPEGEKRDAVRSEIVIVEHYLPKKAGRDEVEKAVDAVLAATDDKAFGPLMKQVLANLGASADGKLVSQILKEKLG